MQFKISGIIREKESGLPISGLLVRAYDKDLRFDDLLGNATTNDKGEFSLCYAKSDFQELFEQCPDIYLKVYAPPCRLVLSTENAIRWNAAHDERFSLEVSRKKLGNASPGQPDDEVHQSLSLSAEDLNIRPTPEGLARIKIEGFGDGGRPGAPALPTKLSFVALPVGADVLDIQVHTGEAVVRKLEAQPFPMQDDQPDLGTDAREFGDGVSIDNHFYRYTPLREQALIAEDQKLVELEKTELFGDAFQVVALRIRPVQYDAATNAVTFYPKLQFRVKFDQEKARRHADSRNGGLRIGALALEQAQIVSQYVDMTLAKDLLWGKLIIVPEDTPHLIITDNYQWPESIEQDDGTTRPPTLAERGSALSGDMVAAFETLAKWKTSRGVRSRVVTISEIVSNVYGNFNSAGFARDLPELIRNFIKHAHKQWDTLYVLLAGDINVVPMRRLTGSSLYSTVGCGRTSENPPPEAKAKVLSAQSVVKVRPAFTPQASDPLSTYHGALRIPFDREAGPGRLGWYYTDEASFNSKLTGFVRLNAGQTSRFIIVEGPQSVIDDDYYWVRDVNSIPSDLYYSSLVGTGYSVPGKHDFDDNHNGLYGQFHYDNGHTALDSIDEASDVWVGRAPAESGVEAQAFVDKIITYERLATPDGEQAVDSSYLQKIIYAAAVWGRLHYYQQSDTSEPPAEKKFTHVDGSTLTKLRTHFDMQINGGIPSYRVVANTSSAQIIIPYKTNASATNLGWFFTTSDDYATLSATPTRFIKIRGPEASIDPSNFYMDPVGLEGSVQEKEAMRTLMNSKFPGFSQVQRHYEDHFDLSAPPPLQPLNSADVKSAINAGVHFLSLTGHGSSGGCCGVSSNASSSFTNDNKFFIAFADSCSTGRPDGVDSLAEKAVVDPDGGGIAYVGNTRYSWIGVGDNYERFFWSALQCFGRAGPAAGMRLGTEGMRNLWTVYAQTLYGDPETPVWTAPPKSCEVSHASSVSAGGGLTVNVYTAGLPASGQKITLLAGWSSSKTKPKLLVSKTTDASGTATFAIPANVGATSLQVTVTKSNYRPYVGFVDIELPIVGPG